MAEHDSPAKKPHVALLPGSGMGHLNPFLKLATKLASSGNCIVTLIAAKPMVSAAESNTLSEFLAECSRHPDLQHIHCRDFQIPSDYLSGDNLSGIDDPFFRQFKAISSSVHLTLPILNSLSPPLSCIFTDFVSVGGIIEVVDALSVPFYVVSVTCAEFFSVMACVHHLELDPKIDRLELPGLFSMPTANLPLQIFNPNSIFTSLMFSNSQFLCKAKGIIFNTFLEFEPQTVSTINNNSGGGGDRVLPNLPPFLPVGPYFYPENFGKSKGASSSSSSPYLYSWLDEQPAGSVLYVSFGSRSALSKEQIKELGLGLERSGCRFLWVLKGSVVDKDDDDDDEIEKLVGNNFLESTKGKGLVIKEWVEQDRILKHPAILGFLSHAGWNSVTEAARFGIPLLTWPLGGDHKVNAEVAKKAKMAMGMKNWSFWEKNLLKGEEIAESIMEFLKDKVIMTAGAKRVMEMAKIAVENGGSSDIVFREIISNF